MKRIGMVFKDLEIVSKKEDVYECKCLNCDKVYFFKWDNIRKRKTNFCKCGFNIKEKIKEDLTGKIYGNVIVEGINIKEYENSKEKYSKKVVLWDCKCIFCNDKKILRKCDLDRIKRINTTGCLCEDGKIMVGARFGKLVIESFYGSKDGERFWNCKCDCGNITRVSTGSLTSGNTMSCGCIRIEKLLKWREEHTNDTKHSEKRDCTRLYTIWGGMKSRCNCENNHAYKYYGGKGVMVCDEWVESFVTFRNWSFENGYNEALTIDRIDANGNYEPSNCRWVDMKVQANNKTNNKYISYNGIIKTLSEWCDELNLPYDRTKARLNALNMSAEEAFKKEYYNNNGSRETI